MKTGNIKYVLALSVLAALGACLSALAADEVPDTKASEPDEPSAFTKTAALSISGDPVNGERLFRMNCAACHGYLGRGDGPMASSLAVPPANLRSGERMNMIDNDKFRRVLEKGGRGKLSKLMPSFGATFNQLEIYDIIAAVRSFAPSIVKYYPTAKWYVGKNYGLDKYAQKRVSVALGSALPPSMDDLTVFTVYKKMKLNRNPGLPRLVEQKPSQLDRLKKANKLGYLAFMEVDFPGVGKLPVAIAVSKRGSIQQLAITDHVSKQARMVENALQKFVGKGRRGGKYDKKLFRVRDRHAAKYTDVVFRMWVRALEGSFAFEKEERERTAFDNAFDNTHAADDMGQVDFKVDQ